MLAAQLFAFNSMQCQLLLKHQQNAKNIYVQRRSQKVINGIVGNKNDETSSYANIALSSIRRRKPGQKHFRCELIT